MPTYCFGDIILVMHSVFFEDWNIKLTFEDGDEEDLKKIRLTFSHFLIIILRYVQRKAMRRGMRYTGINSCRQIRGAGPLIPLDSGFY